MEEKQAFTIAEVSTMTGFSRQIVTRMFENEPGVLVVGNPTTMNRRRYRSMRIPRHVYERVVRRYEV